MGGLLVVVQRPPPAKNYAFLAGEDASGIVNVIVAPPGYEQCREALHGALVLVDGMLQEDHGATPHCVHARKSPKRSGVGVGASVNVMARQIDAAQGRWLMRSQTV